MTVDMRTGGIALITAIQTIVPAITFPARHDALAIAATKVIRRTGAVDLIRAIRTIVVAIALILPK